MLQRVSHVSVFQTAKLFAVLYVIMGLLFIPFFWLAGKAAPTESAFPFGGVTLFLLPLLYGVFGFVFTAIAAAVYNFVAGTVGGIEIELTPGSPAA